MMTDTPAHSVNVGIMADSHGDAAAIRTAIRQFRRLGCRQIYHLGDICDSAHPETADACLRLLRSAAVIAIRGNNDHSIVANCRRRQDPPVSPENLHYLEALPLKREDHGAAFVHSLPFTEALGPASMIGNLAPGEIGEAIKRGGWKILFRGHSHDPQIMWIGAGKARVRPLLPGERVVLAGRLPCVVTCGALSSGYSMIWIPSQHAVTCLYFSAAAAG
jgi:predicted phosphodiesterase